MIDQLLTRLGKMADALAGVFLLPGGVLLSLIAWALAAVLAVILLKLFRNVAHQVRAIVLTFWYRLRVASAGWAMRARWKFRGLFRRRDKRSGVVAATTIEFDDLDVAILCMVAAQGPGFALSAPELAERFGLRPAQLQGSLDKLSSIQLLASVIGTTDGFENYRVTDAGLAFVARFQRERASFN